MLKISGSPIVTQKRSSCSTNLSGGSDASSNIIRNQADASDSLNNDVMIVPIMLNQNKIEGEDLFDSSRKLSLSVIESNQEHALTAAMTIQYYIMIRRSYTKSNAPSASTTIAKTETSVIADVHIYISPWEIDALLPCDGSEKHHHQFVCSVLESEEEIHGSLEEVQSSSSEYQCPEYFYGKVHPQIIFSSSGRYLSCIIPCPVLSELHQSSSETDTPIPLSLMAIFPLTSPTTDDNFEFEVPAELPQPPYLKNKKNSSLIAEKSILVPLVSKPHTLCVHSEPTMCDLDRSLISLMTQVVSIADFSFSGLEMVLAGCKDGSLVLVSCRNAMLLGILYRPLEPCSIIDLQCIKYDNYARIAVISDDSRMELYQCTLFWKLDPVEDKIDDRKYYDFIYRSNYRPFRIRTVLVNTDITPAVSSDLRFNKVIFMDKDTIATLVKPVCVHDNCEVNSARDKILAQVWLFDSTNACTSILSNLENDDVSSTFDTGKSENSIENISKRQDMNCFSGFIKIDYRSQCILVGYTIAHGAIAILWNWRNTSKGFNLLCPVERDQISNQQQLHLYWECDNLFLLHEYVHAGQFKKDRYDLSISSPSTCTNVRMPMLNGPNTIILGNNYVAYPYVCERATQKVKEIKWKASNIPMAYLDNNGPIHIAVLGQKYGKTLVLAGSSGLCLLNIYPGNEQSVPKMTRMNEAEKPNTFYTTYQLGLVSGIDKCHAKLNQDKWRMFRRREEEKIEVLSVALWENYIQSGDDLVVTLVKFHDSLTSSRSEVFLSAWSSRCLDINKQLLLAPLDQSTQNMMNKGVRLDNHTNPGLSILPFRDRESVGNQSHASILVTHQSDQSVSYQVFHIRASCFPSTTSSLNYVKCYSVLNGNLNVKCLGLSSIFLAACSSDSNNFETSNQYSVIIGILFDYGNSLWAYLVGQNGVKSKSLIFSSSMCNESPERIVQFWNDDHFAPTVKEKNWFVWTLALTDGSLISWISGKSLTEETHHFGRKFYRVLTREDENRVHDSFSSLDLSFGMVTTADARIFSSNVERGTYLLGPLPNYGFRHLLNASQKTPVYWNDDLKKVSFDVWDFDIGIPSYTSNLLLCLCIISEHEINGNYSEADGLRSKLILDLKELQHFGNTLNSLRVIALYLTDLSHGWFAKSKETKGKNRFLEVLQSQLVRVSMYALNQIQFVSLFVSIGRQLELQQVPHLFPLRSNDVNRIITIADLFEIAVKEGSFSTSAATLPLFPDPDHMHNLCVELMHNVICTLHSFNSSNSSIGCIREELSFMRQLYHYCLKIEDARIYHNNQTQKYSSHSNKEDDSDRVTITTLSKIAQIRRMHSFVSLFNPLALARKLSNNEELRITEAACSFILSGYGENDRRTDFDSASINDRKSFSKDSLSLVDEIEFNIFDLSASTILMMSITSIAFLNCERSLHSFQSIAMICRLLYDKVEGDVYHRLKRFICDIGHDDIESFIELSRWFSNSNQAFDLFLKDLISDCKKVWDTKDATCVIQGLLTLLSKNEVDTFTTSLVILLLPALHISDAQHFLMSDAFKNSFLGHVYYKLPKSC